MGNRGLIDVYKRQLAQPSQPTILASGTVTSSSVALSWTASTASQGISGYTILRNGNKVGTSTSTSFTDTGLAASTSYSYTCLLYTSHTEHHQLYRHRPHRRHGVLLQRDGHRRRRYFASVFHRVGDHSRRFGVHRRLPNDGPAWCNEQLDYHIHEPDRQRHMAGPGDTGSIYHLRVQVRRVWKLV